MSFRSSLSSRNTSNGTRFPKDRFQRYRAHVLNVTKSARFPGRDRSDLVVIPRRVQHGSLPFPKFPCFELREPGVAGGAVIHEVQFGELRSCPAESDVIPRASISAPAGEDDRNTRASAGIDDTRPPRASRSRSASLQ